MEIIVGESIVLPCQVASDPVLDVSFSWAFNGQLISKADSHFELVGGVSDRECRECANGQLAPLTGGLCSAPLRRCHEIRKTACGLTLRPPAHSDASAKAAADVQVPLRGHYYKMIGGEAVRGQAAPPPS